MRRPRTAARRRRSRWERIGRERREEEEEEEEEGWEAEEGRRPFAPRSSPCSASSSPMLASRSKRRDSRMLWRLASSAERAAASAMRLRRCCPTSGAETSPSHSWQSMEWIGALRSLEPGKRPQLSAAPMYRLAKPMPMLPRDPDPRPDPRPDPLLPPPWPMGPPMPPMLPLLPASRAAGGGIWGWEETAVGGWATPGPVRGLAPPEGGCRGATLSPPRGRCLREATGGMAAIGGGGCPPSSCCGCSAVRECSGTSDMCPRTSGVRTVPGGGLVRGCSQSFAGAR